MSETIEELKQILSEMADMEDGKETDDILFTHEFCVKASAELEAMTEKIADYEEEEKQETLMYRRIMEERCASDEVHCTCVPPLRKRIAELEKVIKKVEADLRDDAFEIRTSPTFRGVFIETADACKEYADTLATALKGDKNIEDSDDDATIRNAFNRDTDNYYKDDE